LAAFFVFVRAACPYVGTIPAVHLAGKHPKLASLILESGMGDAFEWVVKKLNVPVTDLDSKFVGRMLCKRQSILRDFPGAVLLLHTADEECFPLEDHGRPMAKFRHAP
jgi:hypothetical protein